GLSGAGRRRARSLGGSGRRFLLCHHHLNNQCQLRAGCDSTSSITSPSDSHNELSGAARWSGRTGAALGSAKNAQYDQLSGREIRGSYGTGAHLTFRPKDRPQDDDACGGSCRPREATAARVTSYPTAAANPEAAPDSRVSEAAREFDKAASSTTSGAHQGAVASTEVKQKLQEFLLSKSATKDTPTNGKNHSVGRHPKLWYTAAHHTSLDQSSPPLSGTSPSYKYTLPGAQDTKDDFPLRKTESSVSSSSPGSGPSSPNNGPAGNVTENEASVLPPTPHPEQLVPQQRILIHEDSMNLLSLYTSPSLPNITLGLPAVPSPLSASNSLKDKQKCETQMLRQGVPLPGQYGSGIAASSSHAHVAMEGKPNSSHQALLQHLLLKEQMRQQKLLVAGGVPLHPQSPLATKERISPGIRGTHKLPRHRPLNRTQSAPLPQSTLAQLVIQQQHQQFLEKQKQYQQQIHMNKLLSKSIEQLKQPGSHLEEAEEELQGDQAMEERATSKDSGTGKDSSACVEDTLGQVGAVKVKEEPVDSDEDAQMQEMECGEQAAFMQQVIGKDLAPGFVIKVII
uniref:histone deacetylase n=1 Tax=Rattus norvegicus TaxID=10116 RepID=A0ABK0LEG6_RAT